MRGEFKVYKSGRLNILLSNPTAFKESVLSFKWTIGITVKSPDL